MRSVFLCLIVAALLLPAIFRRQRRRAGLRAGELTPRYRRRLLACVGLSAGLLIVGVSGIAVADNGDRNGSNTPAAQSAAPADGSADQQTS
ncbi:MAG: hypothetical protein WCK21_07645, partial [Actinomycetota bacterium]